MTADVIITVKGYHNIGGSDQSRRDMLLTVRTTTVEPVSPGE